MSIQAPSLTGRRGKRLSRTLTTLCRAGRRIRTNEATAKAGYATDNRTHDATEVVGYIVRQPYTGRQVAAN